MKPNRGWAIGRETGEPESSTNPVERTPAHSQSGIIYGVLPVVEALRAGRRQIEQITIAEGVRPERLKALLALARNAHVPVHRVPRIQIDRLVGGALHQGVLARIAVAKYRDPDDLLDEIANKLGTEDPPLALGLDGIEDPRNLGAILRTAECTAVHGVFIPERRAVGLTESVAKSAAGALEHVQVARVTNLVRLIGQLKERNIWIVGAASEGKLAYTDWDWTLPTALLLGSEGEGLHRLVRESCDVLLRIPVLGQLESLNVSVAAGVLLYEARRQRHAKALNPQVS